MSSLEMVSGTMKTKNSPKDEFFISYVYFNLNYSSRSKFNSTVMLSRVALLNGQTS